MTIRNLFFFFNSPNLLRYNLHSATCTDLKRAPWGILDMLTPVLTPFRSRHRIFPVPWKASSSPFSASSPPAVVTNKTSITILPILELHISEIVQYGLFFLIFMSVKHCPCCLGSSSSFLFHCRIVFHCVSTYILPLMVVFVISTLGLL